MSKCMCGAYDCGACYPTTYKKYIAQEETEDGEDGEEVEEQYETEEDEDIARSRQGGREH